jgi:hypothetical protein
MRGGLLIEACHDFLDQVRSLVRLNRGQPSSLHRRADQPGAATAARFQVGIDVLREHLRTLAVQSRRKRLTRNVTPHPCIVAQALRARKGLRAKTQTLGTKRVRASSPQSMGG